ncbi:trimethylamine methyltransferase family protein [Pseudohalocynthiibacter aestuariivivens]|jgi:trimethylamine---corrinoid protein Co-methyltransferase|uniref:Methyltransferase n=1 Tax=Pseudohalocynthiibacter aestuariivivens TaxID=1591409 RepID=A0ABV5JG73_9RHOB|nr:MULTISPECIES: trimethylamine methyltransferase family protein [Pseudohalocynthiibacter]MBS9716211.1 trimethylamine methyltransferase family protein [Pseudohalocynthiibacter aestuariivivens]MCK0100982.1 trimethylamine methyltransferase family protein [Pseudohalocynthiibacter sp. F2068]
MTTTSPRRSGGRAARTALRSAPLAENLRPVRAGMEGGNYGPLTQAGIERIHQAALDALETIGLADAPESGIAVMTAAGAILGDDGRLRFPRALVEDMLAKTSKEVVFHARDPKHDLHLSGNRVHFGTAGAAVHMVDVEGRNYRECTVQDLHDAARICDRLDNIHFVQRPMVCRDIPDNYEMDLNTIYAVTSGTTKHVGTSFTEPDFVDGGLEMLHMIAGGEDKWRARPFVSNSNCFVVPPMKFATESCQVMEKLIRGGMPILLLSAGQAGATAPAPIAGAITQAVAECLAGIIYVNAISPGHPCVFGTWPFVSDLRTGAMSGGSGEQALLTAGCAQMHKFYGLPGGAAAGIADAKLPDMQAGWEQAMSNVMAGLSGLNMVYEAAGMHASLLGFCLESLILGDDLLGQAMRCVRGIEVTEDSVSLEVMRSVCLEGPGHYLGHNQTLSLMQTEYIYPELADRSSPKEWVELGKPDLLKKATARKEEILADRSAARFDPELDAQIRAKFKIHLPS